MAKDYKSENRPQYDNDIDNDIDLGGEGVEGSAGVTAAAGCTDVRKCTLSPRHLDMCVAPSPPSLPPPLDLHGSFGGGVVALRRRVRDGFHRRVQLDGGLLLDTGGGGVFL